MTLHRTSSAHWEGDGLAGKGQLATQSGVFEAQPYSFQTRFLSEDGKAGTNPEELIAAAHAGCFTMAFSAKLGEAGFTPTSIDTRAEVDLSMEGGPPLPHIRLTMNAVIPGIAES